MSRPVIGISCFADNDYYWYKQRTSYSDAIWNNGGYYPPGFHG